MSFFTGASPSHHPPRSYLRKARKSAAECTALAAEGSRR
jgi:hypothetical protein